MGLGLEEEKWRWAGRVARYDHKRWAIQAMLWQPKESPQAKGRRPEGQRKRWCDDIVQFMRSKGMDVDQWSWRHHAANQQLWESLENEFCVTV